MEARQYDNIVKIFEKIKIFDPSKQYTNAQISAWCTGFDLVNQEIEKALNNFFISTCDEEGIEKFESFTKSIPLGTLEDRRNKVLGKYKLYEHPSTKSAFEEKLKSLGIECEIVDGEGTQCTINVTSMTNISSEELEEYVKNEFPINFTVEFNYL